MTLYESIGFWIAVAMYGLASVAIFGGLSFSREKWLRWATWFSWAGVVGQLIAIAGRWQASGHLPYVGAYENVMTGSVVMVIGYLLVAWKWPGLRIAGALVLPTVLLTLGYGYSQALPAGPVTAPYRSGWLVVHVNFAWITYAAYSTVAGLALAMLVRDRAEKNGTAAKGIPAWVPPSEKIDDLSLKLVAFGFLNNAVMIASGAIWAYRLWGSYWSWDPVETWSLLTWLAYGFYMHARLTLNWRGPKLAWIGLASLFGVMMAFWGVQLAPTSWHIFRDMGGEMIKTSRPM